MKRLLAACLAAVALSAAADPLPTCRDTQRGNTQLTVACAEQPVHTITTPADAICASALCEQSRAPLTTKPGCREGFQLSADGVTGAIACTRSRMVNGAYDGVEKESPTCILMTERTGRPWIDCGAGDMHSRWQALTR